MVTLNDASGGEIWEVAAVTLGWRLAFYRLGVCASRRSSMEARCLISRTRQRLRACKSARQVTSDECIWLSFFEWQGFVCHACGVVMRSGLPRQV